MFMDVLLLLLYLISGYIHKNFGLLQLHTKSQS